MSEVKKYEEFFTILKNDQFLRLADNSIMGITIIRRGYLKYFNTRFEEIFGFTEKEINKWKKFEYFKIIHPEDQQVLLQNIKVEDKKNAVLRFRGVKKSGEIIPIENYIYRITYNNKYAYFSNYVQLDNSIGETYTPILIQIKKEKKLVTNYHPRVVKFLKDNKIDFDIINHCSYRAEK